MKTMVDDAVGHVPQVAAEMDMAPGMILIPMAAALVPQKAVKMTTVTALVARRPPTHLVIVPGLGRRGRT